MNYIAPSGDQTEESFDYDNDDKSDIALIELTRDINLEVYTPICLANGDYVGKEAGKNKFVPLVLH